MVPNANSSSTCPWRGSRPTKGLRWRPGLPASSFQGLTSLRHTIPSSSTMLVLPITCPIRPAAVSRRRDCACRGRPRCRRCCACCSARQMLGAHTLHSMRFLRLLNLYLANVSEPTIRCGMKLDLTYTWPFKYPSPSLCRCLGPFLTT